MPIIVNIIKHIATRVIRICTIIMHNIMIRRELSILETYANGYAYVKTYDAYNYADYA